MIWYLASALAIWISVSLIFTAILGAGGYRLYKARERDDARREYRWWASRVIEHHHIEPIQPIIRTWQ